MSKLRVAYIVSLVILGVLIAFTVFRPMATGGEYSVVQRAHFLEREDRWIIELHIFNHEAQDTNYTVNFLADEELYTQSIRLRPGELVKGIYQIPRDKFDKVGEVSFAVYKEGETTPFEQATYYLK